MSGQMRAMDEDQSSNLTGVSEKIGQISNKGTNPDDHHVPSISHCMAEYNKLDSFQAEDLYPATQIFEVPEHRELFIAFNKDNRATWLRQLIVERKQQEEKGKLA